MIDIGAKFGGKDILMHINVSSLYRFVRQQLMRLKRLKASPHQIALGFSLGVWCNFTPVIGVHILMSCLLAFLFRANIISSLAGVLITGLPFIFPFFWLASWYVGSKLIFNSFSNSNFLEDTSILNNLTEYFAEMLVGSILLFPIVVVFFYFPIKMIIQIWQSKRMHRMGKKVE